MLHFLNVALFIAALFTVTLSHVAHVYVPLYYVLF